MLLPTGDWQATARCFPELVEELPVGILQFNTGGQVQSANSVARQFLDGAHGAILANAIRDISLALQERAGPVELVLSGVGHLSVRLVALPGTGETHVALLHTNVEERLRQLTLAMRRLVALPGSGMPLERAVREALAIVATVVPTSALAVYQRQEPSGGLQLLAQVGRMPRRAGTDASPSLPPPVVSRVASSGQPATLAVPSTTPPSDVATRDPQLGVLALPVTAGRELRGVLWAMGPTDTFLENELRTFQALADVVAILVERGAQEAELERVRAWQKELAGALGNAVVQETAHGIAEAVGDVAGILGRTEQELAGVRLESLLAPEDLHKFHAALERLQVEGRGSEILTVQWPDGRKVECQVALRAEEKDPRGVVLLAGFRDLTAERRLREEIETTRAGSTQLERLATLGELAAGLVHELSNVLGAVVVNLDVLREDLDDATAPARASSVREVLAETREGASRMVGVLRDVREFSSGRSASEGRADVATVIQRTLRLMGSQLRSAEVFSECAPALPAVAITSHQLSQVLVNLLLNAAQAMPNRPRSANRIWIAARHRDSGVSLTVADNAVGIPAELLPRIFDPFFSTKLHREGTGLGLTICRRIIQGAGGTIDVESTYGSGTTFRISLPAAPDGK
ncbi:MAG: ATP-binding protein [Myxococcota bacterium]